MLGFKKFLNAQVGQQRVEDHIVINNLLQRVGESVGVEDRRDALQQLCNALTDDPAAQSAFASVGFPTICSAIQNDLDDSVVVRTGLEVIALAVAAEQAHDQQVLSLSLKITLLTQFYHVQCPQVSNYSNCRALELLQ